MKGKAGNEGEGMSEREEKVAMDDGAHLWTATTGEGPPLVLCHGGPGSWDYLRPVAGMVDDIVTVHRYDQRGTARSTFAGPYTVNRFVDDLDQIRQHFGYEKWTVGGHSWGANLSVLYALAYPQRAEAIIYISGTGLGWRNWKRKYHEEEEARWTSGERDRYLELKRRERTSEDEREFLILNEMPNFADRKRARHLAERVVAEMSEFKVNYELNGVLGREVDAMEEQELLRKCRGLGMPTLVIHAQADPRPFEAVKSMIEVLPNVRVETLADAGHMPWLENPEALRDVLRDFAKSVVF